MLTSVAICWCGDFYGEIGANYLTETASKALALVVHFSEVISFRTQFRTHLKDSPGAEVDAKATTLAP